MYPRELEFGTGSRDARRCQYTCATNSGKCHLSVTALPTNPVPDVHVVTPGHCRGKGGGGDPPPP